MRQNINALLSRITAPSPFTLLDSGCGPGRDLKTFRALELPAARFDGVFANASLFHIPVSALPRVLRQLHATLKPGGTPFGSNPRGHNEAGWNGDRYGVYYDVGAWRGFMNAANFEELLVYYCPDGLPREQEPWLATVWRAVGCGAGGCAFLVRCSERTRLTAMIRSRRRVWVDATISML